MITPEEKKHLKKILGHDYVSKVQDHLNKNQIKKGNGEDYSAASIRAVLNNGMNNLEIEHCIYEVASEIQSKEAEIKAMRNKLLTGKTTATVEEKKD
ncbi:hypothetical protein [Mesonia mobilis]|uniref:hypothetical protein n=1 Tax=Mesonia mobilis TaxID=369791 RepID=UPI0024BAD6A8|nr:hypothetical protein [Mesonia mobilis]